MLSVLVNMNLGGIMKTILIFSVISAVLVIACGAQPDEDGVASALDVLPEQTLFSMAIVNPASVISSIDGYASGVSLLGESAVSGWILSALDCADMTEVKNKLGVDVDGSLVLYMESMMPQSFGAALSVTDPDTFWVNLGITPETGEPLEGYDVSFIPVDFGNIYFCYTDGLLLGAGSRAGLQSMLENIDGVLPSHLPEIPDGSFYFFANIESFGPMMAGQLAMMEPQILAEMQADNENDMEIMNRVMGMYFDIIGLVLTETRSVDFVLSFGPEYITGSSKVEFIPGSSLDQYIVPAEIDDLTGLISAGNAVAGRFSIDPVTSAAAMNAIFGALGIDNIPQDMVTFWAETSRNTAISMNVDQGNPMHIVAVYEMPEGASLEDVKDIYDIQFAMLSEMFEMPGLTLSGVDYAEFDGMQWITFSMSMDMSALQPEGLENSAPLSEGISWTAWMTVDEGMLYMEMAPEPVTVSQLIAGTYQGETVSQIPQMEDFSSSSEVAMMINIPSYLNMAMAMSGLDVPPIETEPVWLQVEVDFTDGGVNKQFKVSGTGMADFIGQAIEMFSAIAQ
jgi:hypothetical protein